MKPPPFPFPKAPILTDEELQKVMREDLAERYMELREFLQRSPESLKNYPPMVESWWTHPLVVTAAIAIVFSTLGALIARVFFP